MTTLQAEHNVDMEPEGEFCSVYNVQRYLQDYADMLQQLFMQRLEAIRPAVADILRQKILPLRAVAMAEAVDASLSLRERNARIERRREQYEEMYNELDAFPDLQLQLIEAQAKLQDIFSIANKHSILFILQHEHGEHGTSADDITYTLMQFKQQEVAPTDVQRYLDELAATFSLTSHPTNSTSVAHTVAAIALETVLSNTDSTPDDIHSAMDAFIAAPVAKPRKTPALELEELIPIFDNLFAAALIQRDAIESALDCSGYRDMGVHVRTPMLQLEDWSATFDGDGNVNATAQAIREGVERKRRWIAAKYCDMLDSIADALRAASASTSIADMVHTAKQRITAHEFASAEELLTALRELQTAIGAKNKQASALMDDLLYAAHVFGVVGSSGNIRHDANSLQLTLQLLLTESGMGDAKRMVQDKDALSHQLTDWFNDPEGIMLGRLRDVVARGTNFVSSDGDDTPQRIIERLCYLAQHPDIANKLIIAEATHPADAKTAMALLYATGSQVANPDAAQEIVLLVESVDDVRHLEHTIRDLLLDSVFMRHVQAMKKMTVMIAHSDNRRRDGYSAGEVITRTEGIITRLQRDIWEEAVQLDCTPLLDIADRFGIPIYIFDGGGNDLMRGAAVNPGQTGKQHGHAAARENAPTIRTPQNTIQGEQTRLLFGYPACAAMFLEMMVSQAMYAKASVEKRIGVIIDVNNDDAQALSYQIARTILNPRYQQAQAEAQRSAVLFHDAARKAFHRYTDRMDDQTNPFDALYSHSGAWITTLLANRSSRSNQRGKQDGDQTKSVAEIRGNRRALEQRAITGNLLFQLTGTFHLGLLGQLEAFEAIGMEAAEQMFHASLPDRTHIVGIAQQLHMTDFAKAWAMMGQVPPDVAEIEEMAATFRTQRNASQPVTPQETLAFMQDYGLRLAKVIFRVSTGYDADELYNQPDNAFTFQDAYRTLLPDLAYQLDRRHASHEAAHCGIARLERLFSEYPQQKITHTMEMVAVAFAGTLSMDVRPALGPLAVRGAKGVAITHEERMMRRLGARPYRDIRESLHRRSRDIAGVNTAFNMRTVKQNLSLPDNIVQAIKSGNPR